MEYRIRSNPGFTEDQRAQAAQLFWAAFESKLAKLMGPSERGISFFQESMDPGFAIGAEDQHGRLVGLAGYNTPKGRMIDPPLRTIWTHYHFSALWRAPILQVLERRREVGTLLMDGICVDARMRGKGVGTALLHAIKDEAARRGLERVHLNVIDTNPRAKALYAREGFCSRGTGSSWPFESLFGFSYSERMDYDLPKTRSRRIAEN